VIIMQAIRQSDSELEIYALLTGYLETIRALPQWQELSAYLIQLPIHGLDAVRAQLSAFLAALELVSRRMDDQLRVAIKEAVYVFGATLEHLGGLRRRSVAAVSSQGRSLVWARNDVHSFDLWGPRRIRPDGLGLS